MPGHPPARWAEMIPELIVLDYARTLPFWRDVLGFLVQFDRPAERLAMLEHPDGAQLMVFERDGGWETGPFETPLGRGAILQVFVRDARAVAARVERIIFGAWNEQYGACGSVFDIPRDRRMTHRPEVVAGVKAEEAQALVRGYFEHLR